MLTLGGDLDVRYVRGRVGSIPRGRILSSTAKHAVDYGLTWLRKGTSRSGATDSWLLWLMGACSMLLGDG